MLGEGTSGRIDLYVEDEMKVAVRLFYMANSIV